MGAGPAQPTTEMADVLERLRVARSELDRAIDYPETQVGAMNAAEQPQDHPTLAKYPSHPTALYRGSDGFCGGSPCTETATKP